MSKKFIDLANLKSNLENFLSEIITPTFATKEAVTEQLGSHTVKSDVPENAVFTDTVYDDTGVQKRISDNGYGEVAGGKNLVLNTVYGFITVDEKINIDNSSTSYIFYAQAGKTYSFSGDEKPTAQGVRLGKVSSINPKTEEPVNDYHVFSSDVSMFTTNETGYYMLYVYNTKTSGIKFQIEEGSVATEYEPYFPSNKMLAEENSQQSTEMMDIKREQTINMLSIEQKTLTSNGITCRKGADGICYLSGTATADTTFKLWSSFFDGIDYSYRKYKVVGAPEGASESTFCLQLTNEDAVNKIIGSDYGNGFTFIPSEDIVAPTPEPGLPPTEIGRSYVTILVKSGQTLKNVQFKPMVTTNLNATYDDFVPYTGDNGKLNSDVADITRDVVTINSDIADIKSIYSSNSVNLGRKTNSITGEKSSAFGESLIASGIYSHAEGYSTTASGKYSHAEGENTEASSFSSHAEGNGSRASASQSHAEGSATRASGDYSHAEGDGTTASGKSSHAEGDGTTALGNYSHAEGYATTASGNYSHTGGYFTTALGDYSHTEGHSEHDLPTSVTKNTSNEDIIKEWNKEHFSLAKGNGSHIEGRSCLGLGDYSHAEGYISVSSGMYSHAEGHTTTASGESSHAEGESSTASGMYSHAEGFYNTSEGPFSHAEGNMTTASGNQSHAEGHTTTASGNQSHAEGYATTASGESSHAEGENTTASGDFSHAEGQGTTASASYTHSEGVNTSAIGQGSHAEGSNLELSGDNVIFEDPRRVEVYNRDTDDFIFITVAGSQAFGLNSHAEGCSTLAYGKNSHTEGYHTLAQANESHAEGCGCKANASFAHAEGQDTNADGKGAHAEGFGTTASGTYSHAEGFSTTASGTYSHAEGYYTKAANYASHASGKYNAAMTTGGGSSNTTGTAFVIGNGTGSSALSNAFSVQFNGIVKAKSTITASTTADYAEFFEWLDKNPNEEDRVGHFVTLDGDKIRIATSEDDYILGIVSGEPFVLGNGDCDTWNGMYLHDEFRRTMYEPAPKMIEILDSEGNSTGEYEEVEGEYEGTRPILNPDYDPTQEYVSRFDRAEWAPVGMLGVLAVLHDGTAEVNGYVTVNSEGIATKCTRDTRNSYRVIKKVSDKVVEVIFR